MHPGKTVFVVDDDASVRNSVCALANSLAYGAKGFASAEEFLAAYVPGERGVVVVDLRMPGMSGLDFQKRLSRRFSYLPVIILTAYARTPITVQAVQAGAVAMIDKPYHDDELWDAIRAAMAREEDLWSAHCRRQETRDRLAALTLEERAVLNLIVEGKPNKRIARELGVALRTVEKRRHAVLEKMQAGSIAQLVEMMLRVRSES